MLSGKLHVSVSDRSMANDSSVIGSDWECIGSSERQSLITVKAGRESLSSVHLWHSAAFILVVCGHDRLSNRGTFLTLAE